MSDGIPLETHQRLRRLPWTSPEGKAEFVPPGDGMINQIADSAEAHIVCMALDDATYALTMAELPNTTRAELRAAIRRLAGALRDVAHVAELRGERLDEPVHGPAARALGEALRTALRRP